LLEERTLEKSSCIDLWDPKALEAIKDPSKDTHPRAQLLKDWTKTKEEEKEEPPLSLGLDNHYLVSCCSLLCLSFGLYLCLQTLDCAATEYKGKRKDQSTSTTSLQETSAGKRTSQDTSLQGKQLH